VAYASRLPYLLKRELRKINADGPGAPRPEDRERDEEGKTTTIRRVTFSSEATRPDLIIVAVHASAQPSPLPLPKSNASASLLANVLVNTYVHHLPLNRQENRPPIQA
jgi:hypothetical protein